MANQYQKLMDLGRAVITAENIFGVDSSHHKRAVSAWKAQQNKMGISS